MYPIFYTKITISHECVTITYFDNSPKASINKAFLASISSNNFNKAYLKPFQLIVS